MIIIKKIKTIGILVFVLTCFNCKAQLIPTVNQDKVSLMGTWVPEGMNLEDRWVFNSNGNLIEYSNNSISITYNWELLKTSPVCGEEVPTGETFSYLKLVNTKDADDFYCYEITSLDKDLLQIRYFGRGGFLTYVRP